MKLRDIQPGQLLPLAGIFTRTGPLQGDTRALVVRFPVWAFHGKCYSLSGDEFVTGLWAKAVQISFERMLHRHGVVFRIMWGTYLVSRPASKDGLDAYRVSPPADVQ